MAYLALLLSQPGRPVHVLDLVARHAPPGAGVEGGASSGELLDARARREVRQRIHELASAVDEAEAHRDLARAEALRTELHATEQHLAAALGLGGRARRAGDPVERARKSVYNRIRDAIARIGEAHAPLGRHLRSAVRTGRTCVYQPEDGRSWSD